MAYLLLGTLIIAVLFGPSLWARQVLRKYRSERQDIPGTGAQFAQHLISQLKLSGVTVEATDSGDHYNPESRTVGLTSEVAERRSLTAMVVAAHEVGHAIQHAQGFAPLSLRTRLIVFAQFVEKGGAVVIAAMPLVTALTRAPSAGAAMLAVGLLSLGAALVVHLITLPVEWDASFNRALPILERGGYLQGPDVDCARSILRACALTYVAGSLAGLLNIWRWIMIWRR